MELVASLFTLLFALSLGVAGAPLAYADYNGTRPPVYVADSPIAARVISNLAQEKKGGHWGRIVVKIDDQNIVWLSGLVTTQDEAERARKIAAGTEGVSSVQSDIQVKAND